MKIFYDYSNEQWMTTCSSPLLFGKNLQPLKKCSNETMTTFTVKRLGQKVGPLVGILVTKENKVDFFGNKSTFKNIHSTLQEGGGISFVFTPEESKDDTFIGFLYDEGQWRKVTFPLPDIIYNRIATYWGERNSSIQNVRNIAIKNHIPFYNPHFFDKWKTYQLLKEEPTIKNSLPHTELLTSTLQLEKFLEENEAVFIKPVLSSRGKGITLLKKSGEEYIVKSNQNEKRFHSVHSLWCYFYKKKKSYIMQKAINVQTLNDRLYDLRILVQRLKENWNVTGVGIRCAAENAITTHVPNGGDIYPLENVVHKIPLQQIYNLAAITALQLEKSYGYLIEFSMDVGVDHNFHPWIFEINAKPMKFDEINIQQQALQTLISSFYADSGFTDAAFK